MIKILHVTDLHILPTSTDTMLGVNTEKYFRLVLEQAHRQHADFDLMLVTGDLVQDPCPEAYQTISDILEQYPTPSLCLPGNHDDFVLMRQYLKHGQISCHKQIQRQNWQIVCLNSVKSGEHGGLLAQTELDYLHEKLQSSTGLFTLIAVHHHSIPSGSEWMDGMMIENSADLFALTCKYPHVKGILCGHVHQVIEEKYHGLDILASPSTCFQFKPDSQAFALDDKPPGYRVLELHADGQIKTTVSWLPVHLDELTFQTEGY